MRQTAHALLDAALDKLERAYDGRVWTPLPDELKSALKAPVPMQGMPHEEVAKRLTSLLPYGAGNTHPRFFGWVHGSGNPGGLLPEMVAAAMNANCGGRDHAHLYVERQVLAWCRSIMGFPTDCGGLLVSGTSMATLIALKAARDAALGDTAPRKRGLVRAQHQLGAELVGYAAEGAHSCLTRAFDVIGLGTDALRLVPTCEDFTLDVAALRNMIAADAAAGRRPFLIVGTAGSVNVGAVDDLNALADVAAEHSMWLHVDGAFGAPAVLSPVAAPLLAGLERATSLAFDFHKWLHVALPPAHP